MTCSLQPGDLVRITDTDDFDPRIRGKVGIVVGRIEKFSELVSVMVEGKIFGFLPTHLRYLEPIKDDANKS